MWGQLMLYHRVIELQGLKEGLGDAVFLLHPKVTVRIISANQAGCDPEFGLLIGCTDIRSVILRSASWVRVGCSPILIGGVPPVQQSLAEAQSF